MQNWDVGNFLWLASDVALCVLLTIFIVRRVHRHFPIFLAFVVWDLLSDVLLAAVLFNGSKYLQEHYIQIYYSFNAISYLLELAVLVEIAASVFQPAKGLTRWKVQRWMLAAMLILGMVSFGLAVWVNPTPFANLRIFLVMNTAAAILSVIMFLLIAGFSQLLGLNWKNHILQLTTGLAFYSVVELLVELVQSQLRAGTSYAAQYQMWSQIEVIGYLCTLSFWCYAFLKKEAPRKEFSPQMEQILVLLSGGAKRQHAVLARSRDD